MQDRGGSIDFIVAEIEWREAKAHVVGAAEVADHTPIDESLHDFVGMWVPERDLAAAHGRVAGRRQCHAKAAAAPLDKRDKQIREAKTLLAQLIEVHVVPDLERADKCTHGEDRLRPAQHRAYAGAGSERAIESERIRMTPPTTKWLRELAVMAPGRKHKGWRTRAAIEVLVGAANGEIGAVRVEINPQRAHAVAEIPDRDGAYIMDAAR